MICYCQVEIEVYNDQAFLSQCAVHGTHVIHDAVHSVSMGGSCHDSPMKEGWNRVSGQRKRSLPMVMT